MPIIKERKMRFNFLIMPVLAAALFSSCCATRENMENEIRGYKLPVDAAGNRGMALVYVVCPQPETTVPLEVYVNRYGTETFAGYNHGMQYLYFFVMPGRHIVYSKSERLLSLHLNVEAGKTYFVKQYLSPGLFLAQVRLELIDETEGKYYLSHSRQGVMENTVFK